MGKQSDKHKGHKSNRRKDKQERGEREIKDKFYEERVHRAEPIVAKTQNQKFYIGTLRTEKLVVATGCAGTGKTFIASALAADALLRGDIDKIIVARPAVGMGRSIGFRPGTEQEKLYSFLRPMLDTIKKRMGGGAYDVAVSNKQIEIQALDAIRGRSFDDRVVLIVDEVQNSEPDEIQSIVTRIGADAQMILCGDPDQSDIKGLNGIDYICNIIHYYNIQDAAIVEFNEDDIVRSGMAKEFVIAFNKEKRDE